MIKTYPQISAPKLIIFIYSELASHFRLNGVKISLLVAVILYYCYYYYWPFLSLTRFFFFLTFFCFLAHFLLFYCSMSDTIGFSTKFYIRNTSDIGLFIWMNMLFSWFQLIMGHSELSFLGIFFHKTNFQSWEQYHRIWHRVLRMIHLKYCLILTDKYVFFFSYFCLFLAVFGCFFGCVFF